jgi:hypothetical protein
MSIDTGLGLRLDGGGGAPLVSVRRGGHPGIGRQEDS